MRQRYGLQRIVWGMVIMLLGGMILVSSPVSAQFPGAAAVDSARLAPPPPVDRGKLQMVAANPSKGAPAPPQRPGAVLYDQYNNPGTNATSSQNFETANDPFDDELADDFVVPGGQTWDINGVDVQGLYFGCTPPACGIPTSINIVLYNSVVSGTYTIPGVVVASRPNQTFVESPSAGSFAITINPVVSLPAGTYYVSVQPNMDFTGHGQWGWSNRTVQANGPAAWRNPGGGFGVACTNWDVRTFCIGQPTEADQVFRINGNIQGQPTSTPAPPTLTPTATATASCPFPAGWVAGPTFTPGPAVVRAVGVYFPPNAKFYAMGGRSADTAGSDFPNPREYTQGGTWISKAGVYPDNQVNNMACAALTQGSTPYIYCVGGSAAGAATSTGRVMQYDPVADSITTVATDPWPPGASSTLPGGFAVAQNKLYILGGFVINTAMTTQIWEFDPNAPASFRWTQKTATLPVAMGYIPATGIAGLIYTGGGTTFTAPNILSDTVNSYIYNPLADTIGPIASIPRATGETRAVNVGNRMWVLGGGRNAPNPSTQVDIYDPGTNTWSLGLPFTGVRRNFPADSDGVRVWLAGGYNNLNVPQNTMQIYQPVQPCAALVGHVSRQGRPAGYSSLNQLPISLTLRLGANAPVTYPNLITDPRGFFTVTVTGLPLKIQPDSLYAWWAKGPGWLATSGTVNLTGAAVTQQEMGTQPAGDTSDDNLVDITDFSRLRTSFGRICGDGAFNPWADFNGDCLVDISDFSLQRSNFGSPGPPPP